MHSAYMAIGLMLSGIALTIVSAVYVHSNFDEMKEKAIEILVPYPVEGQDSMSPGEHLRAVEEQYPDEYSQVRLICTAQERQS